MWCPLKIVSVLERPRLTFIAIDSKVTRTFGSTDKTPFAAGRKTSTAKAAQATGTDLFLHVFPVAIGTQISKYSIAAICLISSKVLIIRHMDMGIISSDCRFDLVQISMVDVIMADFAPALYRSGPCRAHAAQTSDGSSLLQGQISLAGTGKHMT